MPKIRNAQLRLPMRDGVVADLVPGRAVAWRAGLVIGLLLCGVALAEPADNLSPHASTAPADDARPSFSLGFGAERDDSLHARDVLRLTALMRRARGQMPVNPSGQIPLHQLPG